MQNRVQMQNSAQIESKYICHNNKKLTNLLEKARDFRSNASYHGVPEGIPNAQALYPRRPATLAQES